MSHEDPWRKLYIYNVNSNINTFLRQNISQSIDYTNTNFFSNSFIDIVVLDSIVLTSVGLLHMY